MNISEKVNCKVPFGTISIQPESLHYINNALKNKMVTNGKMVEEFEACFAKKFGVKYAIAVSSGTDADTLALASLYDLGANRGDEIIIPALTFVATANAVVNAGFKPVFVDVDLKTLNIDVSQIENAITYRTRAIMPVHLMGKPANMDEIMLIAKKNNLNVIEDAAEAHGAEYKGRKVGTIAPLSAFSLYAAHIITAVEGGMILTSSEYLYNILKSLRNHGLQHNGSDWSFERIGFSSKMNELEAAIGLGNIYAFDEILEARCKNFKFLSDGFKEFSDYFYTIEQENHEKIGPHAFAIILKENCPFSKKQFVNYLINHGIDNRNLFYSIPTQSNAYRYLGYNYGTFPNSEYLSNYGTHIGVHQDLTIEQLTYVLETVRAFLKGIK